MGAPMGNTNGYRPSQSICWFCKNAVPDGDYGCDWSRFFKPIEGWVVKQTKRKNDRSYCVLECPEFIPEEPDATRQMPLSIDDSKGNPASSDQDDL